MGISGGYLRRMLDYAYMDWQWGDKNAAFKAIFIIIQEVEGKSRGNAKKSPDQSQERSERAHSVEAFEARRSEFIENRRRDREDRARSGETHLF